MKVCNTRTKAPAFGPAIATTLSSHEGRLEPPSSMSVGLWKTTGLALSFFCRAALRFSSCSMRAYKAKLSLPALGDGSEAPRGMSSTSSSPSPPPASAPRSSSPAWRAASSRAVEASSAAACASLAAANARRSASSRSCLTSVSSLSACSSFSLHLRRSSPKASSCFRTISARSLRMISSSASCASQYPRNSRASTSALCSAAPVL
mmetsp:Transcript_58196/g.189675  ORF Transcript_58196/g.189675 Transcript_58196/m.189675 type:complete len:206 (-) Transcript_58196:503-1120(-)